MRSKSSANKLIKFFKMPIRALAKVRDSYVRTMNNYADMGKCEGLGFGGPIYSDPMPRSLSTSTMRSGDVERDFKELVRAASTGALGNKVDIASLFNPRNSSSSSSSNSNVDSKAQHENVRMGCSKGIPRSGSVAMARIEEE